MSSALRKLYGPKKARRPIGSSGIRPIVGRPAHKRKVDEAVGRIKAQNVGMAQHERQSVNPKKVRRSLRRAGLV